MRSGTSFAAMALITILLTLAGLTLALPDSGSTPPGSDLPANRPSAATDGQVEQVESQAEPGALVSETTERAPLSQAAPMPDGPSILQDRCARCHVSQWLEDLEGSQAEWEEALVRMEAKGVRLSEPEKNVLLHYLAAAENP